MSTNPCYRPLTAESPSAVPPYLSNVENMAFAMRG